MVVDAKKCTKCGEVKPLRSFYTNKRNRCGRKSECKVCSIIASKALYKANPEKGKARTKAWKKANPQKVKAWKEANPDYWKNWVEVNRDRRNEYNRIYEKTRRVTNPQYKLVRNIRAGLNHFLKGTRKSRRTMDYVGCTREELIIHLEKQFQPGMTWENWSNKGWHIDHIIPLAYFDHNDEEQVKKTWNYTNLQPLWAHDNQAKSDKMDDISVRRNKKH